MSSYSQCPAPPSRRPHLDAQAPVREWNEKFDPRSNITLRQLLNMSSGLAFNEPYDPGSDSTKMLFESHDMDAYAAAKPLEHPPGTFWSYSSGTANILSRLVFQQTGGTLATYEAYAHKVLFEYQAAGKATDNFAVPPAVQDGLSAVYVLRAIPFKTGDHSIVILKSLPVFQCEQCSEYSMDDPTFQRVEEILARVDSGAELEIIPFAA